MLHAHCCMHTACRTVQLAVRMEAASCGALLHVCSYCTLKVGRACMAFVHHRCWPAEPSCTGLTASISGGGTRASMLQRESRCLSARCVVCRGLARVHSTARDQQRHAPFPRVHSHPGANGVCMYSITGSSTAATMHVVAGAERTPSDVVVFRPSLACMPPRRHTWLSVGVSVLGLGGCVCRVGCGCGVSCALSCPCCSTCREVAPSTPCV